MAEDEPKSDETAFVASANEPFRPPARVPIKARPTFLQRVRQSSLTFSILVINVLVFLGAESAGSTLTTGTLLQFGASEQLHVWIGEYWRLVTPMFLHIGWMHLIWNGYASVGWSVPVEAALGKPKFALLYLLSGIGGCAMSVCMHRVVSAGASGAMFGIVGATLVLRRRQLPSWAEFWSDRGIRSTLITIGIWTLLGITALAMDNYAHLGGFLVGLALTWSLTSPAPARASGWGFAAAFALLLLFAIRPWWRPTEDDAGDLTSFGAAYLTGKNFPRDDTRAAKFFERACSVGEPNACGGLGFLRYAQSPEAGMKLMNDACEKGSTWSCEMRDAQRSEQNQGPAPSPPETEAP